jgi:acyl-homoserine lactone acylase PvdQ
VKRLVVLVFALACTTAPVAQAAPLDFGRQTWNILPPGQTGSLPPDTFGTNQLNLYDELAPLFGDVGPGDVRRLFKSARFFAPAGGEVTRPRRGVTIRRDRSFGVPHIRGRTRSNVFFGIGWATAEDRGLFMETIRYPSRLAIVDAPGLSALRLATSLRSFEPSAQTERFIRRQRRLIVAKGREGRRVLKDVNAFTAGINAYYRETDNDAKPWTQVDVLSVTGLLGQVFGAGGGDEVRRGLLLSALRRRLGARTGDAVWRDLRSSQDPETSVTTSRRFPYTTERRGRAPGSLVPDPNSLDESAGRAARVAQAARGRASNAVLVGRKRSATGHPLAVMGPQLGFYYPELFLEVDAHGGGIHARGGALPGLPYVLIGRARDYAWSATAAGTDNTDQFLERLCNPDGSAPTRASTHYRYRGRCRPMSIFNAGLLGAGEGEPAEQVVFRETVHGPVSGTVTVRGRPYAVANLRASRGREAMNAFIGSALNEGAIRSGRDFPRVANKLEFTFNLFYVDHRDIAFFSTGRLPVRARGTDPSLPTLGTGRYDWRGFLSRDRHPQAVNPKSGLILNWNNKPAAGFGAADSNWSYQSVHRNDLFKGFKRRNRLHDVLSVVNRAATQDLRAVEVWPVISDVLDGGAAPDARSRQAADLLGAWVRRGASRLDRDLDGKVDHPGAAVLDQVWDALSETVLRPVLGDLAAPGGLFGQLIGRDNSPRRGNGGAYGSGWYGYVEKDLRSLLGRRVRGAYSRRYCGNGDLAACRRSLWAVVKQSADLLAAFQGADPSAWRSDATEERIEFQPGVLGPRYTMRWANRPTLHQLMEFRGHRRMGRPRG